MATMTWSSTAIPTTSPTWTSRRVMFRSFLAGLRVAAGMVVDQDHGRGRVHDGRLEHLARVHDRRVEAADRDHFAALHLVPRVEQQHDEVLLACAGQVAHLGEHVLGDCGSPRHRAPPRPPCVPARRRPRARPRARAPRRARAASGRSTRRPARPGCGAPGGARCATRCARPCPIPAPAPAVRHRPGRTARGHATSPAAAGCVRAARVCRRRRWRAGRARSRASGSGRPAWDAGPGRG